MKYKIGDIVYVTSTYNDNIVERKIKSIINEEDRLYELDNPVRVEEKLYIGYDKMEYVNISPKNPYNNLLQMPAPEWRLLQISDLIPDTTKYYGLTLSINMIDCES